MTTSPSAHDGHRHGDLGASHDPLGRRRLGGPAGVHPLTVAHGAVGRRPPSVEGAARELLSMTVLFDHDVVDGLPVALILRRLSALMESASGL